MKQVTLLNKNEARQTINLIKENIKSTRTLIVDFYEREGWRSLGYSSFVECIQNEFSQSASYVYRQLNAGQMEKELPIGEIGDNRESHLRALSVLKTNEQKERAWIMANSMSDSPTAATFDHAAKYVWVTHNTDIKEVKDRMISGELSPDQAYQISKRLDGMPADFVNVAKKVTDPELVPMLLMLYNDQTDTWQEIELTEHIPSVDEQIPIKIAARQNLSAYLNIASNEHRAAAIEINRERFSRIRNAVNGIISQARLVDRSLYPELAKAINDYDDVIKKK